MVFVDSAGITDVGKKRDKNEDAILIDRKSNLFVVADGMGGHLAGEVASNIVIETIKNHIKTYDTNNIPDDVVCTDDIISEDASLLVSSINIANSKVYCQSMDNKSWRGMASTVSAALVSDETIIVANVGDSPIYLVSNGDIELVSVMHTLSNEQPCDEFEETIENKYRHILTRGIGVKETVKIDFCEIPYSKGDQLIICSDGLSNKVSEKEILNEVTSHAPEKACRILVDMANERGGDDNITIIVLKIKNPCMFIISHAGKKIRNFFHKLI